MSAIQHSFSDFEPVWAKLGGYPWWPARIVRLEDISAYPERQPELQPKEGELLVQFFNDGGRAAVVAEGDLRPFHDPRYRHFGRVEGQHKRDLLIAYQLGKQYCTQRNWPNPDRRDPGAVKSSMPTERIPPTRRKRSASGDVLLTSGGSPARTSRRKSTRAPENEEDKDKSPAHVPSARRYNHLSRDQVISLLEDRDDELRKTRAALARVRKRLLTLLSSTLDDCGEVEEDAQTSILRAMIAARK